MVAKKSLLVLRDVKTTRKCALCKTIWQTSGIQQYAIYLYNLFTLKCRFHECRTKPFYLPDNV